MFIVISHDNALDIWIQGKIMANFIEEMENLSAREFQKFRKDSMISGGYLRFLRN